MWSTSPTVAAGDQVIVWLTRDAVLPITITPGDEFNGRFGSYKHTDLIGVLYGSRVASRSGKGFIHLLRPTPELWTLALPHRTQIVYLADIAFITARLGIRPGSRVIEAGTGSGSFSHSVARTIGSTGRLYTFEFHQSRVAKARGEFTQHGLSDHVFLEHRNVCKVGFGIQNEVDSVFLDLPAPWDAIPHVKQAARKDRIVRICCFSPCVEQVLRTVSVLNEYGFTDITMYETLLRPHEVAQPPVPVSVQTIRAKLQTAEVNKEERRLKQIAASRAKRAAENAGDKRKRSTSEEEAEGDEWGAGVKRKRDDGRGEEASVTDHGPGPEPGPELCTPLLPPPGPSSTETRRRTPTETATHTVTQPIREVRGHTSYLTFASLVPSEFVAPGPRVGAVMAAVPEPEQSEPECEHEPGSGSGSGPVLEEV